MAIGVKIGGPEGIQGVGAEPAPVPRYPIADAADFGGASAQAEGQMGAAIAAIGDHLTERRRVATDQVAHDTASLDYATQAQKATLDLQNQYPAGGQGFTDALKQKLDDLKPQVLDGLSQKGLSISPVGQDALNHHFSEVQQQYMLHGLTFENNAQVSNLKNTLGQNADAIGADVYSSGDIDAGLKRLDQTVGAGRGLMPAPELDEFTKNYRKSLVTKGIDGYLARGAAASAAGDADGAQKFYDQADTLRRKYLGDESNPAQQSGVGQQSSIIPVSPILAQRRTGFKQELDSNPQLRQQVAGMAILEGAKDPVPVIESLANRYDYVNSERAKSGLPPVSIGQMLSGGFYGPINRGQLPSALRQLDSNPALQSKMGAAIDAVTAGSNTINGATDQGLPTDPNGQHPGGRIIRGGNVFNDWGGGPGGHEGARQYRESLQQSIASGGTSQVSLNSGGDAPAVSSPTGTPGAQYAQADTGIASDAGPQSASPDGAVQVAANDTPQGGQSSGALTPDANLSFQLKSRIQSARNASVTDKERAIKLQAEQAKQLSDKAEDETFQKIVGKDPSVTATSIASDPRLTPERKEKMVDLLTKATKDKDSNTYGAGFYDLFKQVHADPTDPKRITDPSQLYAHVGDDGDLTMAGLDKLRTELQGKKTPDGEAEGAMKAQLFKYAASQLSAKNDLLHIKDPKGEEVQLKWMAQFYSAYEKGKTNGKTTAELLTPGSSDYLGKSVDAFKRSPAQINADILAANGIGGSSPDAKPVDTSTPQGLIAAVQSGKMTRADGEALAIKNGWIRANPPPPVVAPAAPVVPISR